MIFCIDSNIFIWGIKNQATESELHRIDEARDFIKWASDNGHHIMIASVVIAECLSREPIEMHSEYLKIVYENFIVANFDERAATKYAEILNMDKFKNAVIKGKEIGIGRQEMKIDYLIVACAIANGANRIYSHDEGLCSFSEGLIEALPMPKISKPLTLDFPTTLF